MKTFTGTQDVDPGLYLNLRKFSMTTVEKRGALPGSAADTYRRVPILLMLLAAPVMGLVYVIFLPFIGFAAVGVLLTEKAMDAGRAVGVQMRRVRTPGWAPAMAFFSRTKVHKTPEEAPEDVQHDAWTDEVEKKLNETDRAAR